jgi:hypothetical protein
VANIGFCHDFWSELARAGNLKSHFLDESLSLTDSTNSTYGAAAVVVLAVILWLAGSLGLDEAGDSVRSFSDFIGGVVAAFGHGLRNAVTYMFFEKANGNRLQRPGHGRDLGEDIDAVVVLGDHALQAAYLPLHAAQSFYVAVLVVGIPMHVFLRWLRVFRSHEYGGKWAIAAPELSGHSFRT